MNSTFGKLNWLDLGKSALVVAGTTALAAASEILKTGTISLKEVLTIASAALFAGGGYLVKQIFTNSEGIPLKTEQKVSE